MQLYRCDWSGGWCGGMAVIAADNEDEVKAIIEAEFEWVNTREIEGKWDIALIPEVIRAEGTKGVLAYHDYRE